MPATDTTITRPSDPPTSAALFFQAVSEGRHTPSPPLDELPEPWRRYVARLSGANGNAANLFQEMLVADFGVEGAQEVALRIKQARPEVEAQAPGPRWPDLPADAAFHGLAGDITRTVEPHSEADPVAILLQTLVAFGNAIGRHAFFRVEANRHFTNLNAVIVGKSAKGRKGTSWGHVRNFLAAVDRPWTQDRIASGLSSGEGLIWAVRDPIEKQQPLKKKGRIEGYETVMADPGVEDKRLLVMESEFASSLRVCERDGSTLSAVMRQAWDDGDLNSLTKNSQAAATGAHISILGHITKDELLRYMTRTEAANGLANRFLWACVKRSKLLPEGGRLGDVDLSILIRRLDQAVSFAREAEEIVRDPRTRARWKDEYPELSAERPGMFGAVTGRAEAQVTRLSCIYALLDRSTTVAIEHLEAALALWRYCEASCRYIFGDSLGDPVADEILRALRSTPEGITRTEISDLFKRNQDSGRINAALSLLAEHKLARLVRVTGGQGRPLEKWYALGYERNEKYEKSPSGDRP